MADCIREGIGLYLASAQADGGDLLGLAGRFSPQTAADLKPHDAAWIDTFRSPSDR